MFFRNSRMDDRDTSILMNRYQIGRLLGQGTFAKVYHARNIETGQSVAIKVIEKGKVFKEGAVEQIKREISIMRIVRHPFIINLYEVMATRTRIYFVMEYAKGGELFNKLANRRLKEEFARKYFHQLINAVEFCHSRGVYHRDLKPENILLDENKNLKVSDFGLSALSGSRHRDGLLHTVCGTPAYVAPEVISRKGYDGDKADIWSCGVILYALLAGFLPFTDPNLMEMYRKIGKSDLKFPPWFKADAKRLIFRMLDPHPSTRITIAKIKESPWYRKGLISESSAGENSKAAPENVGSSSSSGITSDTERPGSSSTPSNLNAFDIISLSQGFDLSKLFEDSDSPCCKKEHRFVSWKPASAIISKLEEVARRLRLKISKKEKGMLLFEGANEGRKGTLSIDAEVFELASDYHLVEVKKKSGDSFEYKEMFDEGMRPCLQDIVWAWQDEPGPEPKPETEPETEFQEEEDEWDNVKP